VPRLIISGGGTGGHIFPALAIADALKRKNPNTEILFVGAIGKMEMERVPKAGYKIIGLPIMGIQRRLTLKNLKVPFMIIKSLWRARKVIQEFQPNAVIGVGGYASGPLLRMASWMGYPTMIQEQNSYPGVTNKILAKKAKKIFVAYEGMERFFPEDKLILSGNPIRKQAVHIEGKRAEAASYFSLDQGRLTLFFVGGSLGAQAINQAVEQLVPFIEKKNVQVLWQTGANAFEALDARMGKSLPSQLKMLRFIDRMDLAYALSDIIISRAGAMSISGLCVIGKPVIFIPSPYVSEDHQTKNALSLTSKNAAILLKETEVSEKIEGTLEKLISDEALRLKLGKAIKALARPKADDEIAEEIMKSIHQ